MPVVIKDEDGKNIVVTKVKIENAPGFTETYATGVQGGNFGPYDFRLAFYDQKVEKDEDKEYYEKRLVKQSIIVPYATAKQMSIWLKKHIDEFEKLIGHEIYIGETEIE